MPQLRRVVLCNVKNGENLEFLFFFKIIAEMSNRKKKPT